MDVDLFLPSGEGPFPVLVFCHGFKGFKHWGYIPFLHEYFSAGDYAILSFNHSHNGILGDNDVFTELDQFQKNTVSKEQGDLEAIGKWIFANAKFYNLAAEKISWLGHSRGGANVIVFANRFQEYVEKVIVWSPIPSFEWLFEQHNPHLWKKHKTVSIANTRTKQQLPLDYCIWEDLETNKKLYNVYESARSLGRPLLIIHGEKDESVPVILSESIAEACIHSVRMTIPNASHTYGMKHPCKGLEEFTQEFWLALDNTLSFLEDI
ncbi:MAG: alpha/beta hydrolase [Flavobacteriaceae bacterium]|nr:alpha/beta hydrolase [Flavobacteriaceae bacterium]